MFEHIVAAFFVRPRRGNRSFRANKKSYKDFFKFAETAVRLLVQARPLTIADFILRIDIMQANNGRFVVNEFESFGAFICDSSPSSKNELACQHFMGDYWTNVLTHYLKT